jgi:hypothetical protein
MRSRATRRPGSRPTPAARANAPQRRAGFHWWRSSETRPRPSNWTPSRSSNNRCESDADPSERMLTIPRALMTRCHGTVVLLDSACNAYPTSRGCPGSFASAATWPYVATRPLGMRRTTATMASCVDTVPERARLLIGRPRSRGARELPEETRHGSSRNSQQEDATCPFSRGSSLAWLPVFSHRWLWEAAATGSSVTSSSASSGRSSVVGSSARSARARRSADWVA